MAGVIKEAGGSKSEGVYHKSRLEDTADLKLAGAPSQGAGEPPNAGEAGREASAWPTARLGPTKTDGSSTAEENRICTMEAPGNVCHRP